jgi:hypothetical protein
LVGEREAEEEGASESWVEATDAARREGGGGSGCERLVGKCFLGQRTYLVAVESEELCDARGLGLRRTSHVGGAGLERLWKVEEEL